MAFKGRSNVSAMIEIQYEILSHMITEITNYNEKEKQILHDRIEYDVQQGSVSNEEIGNSMMISYEDSEYVVSQRIYECRRMLYCAIYSYFESMLYHICEYFNISLGGTTQISQIINKIIKNKNLTSNTKLNDSSVGYNNEDMEHYRLLRNYIMHGNLAKKEDRDTLKQYVVTNKDLSMIDSERIEICNTQFLFDFLEHTHNIVANIESVCLQS